MALTTIPGFSGYQYARFSSLNRRALGLFSDMNHLSSIQDIAPANYDKAIIQIYTQSALYSNDFLEMINKSTPFYVEYGDSWKWKVEVPFMFAKIVDIPAATLNNPYPGRDGQEFTLILDSGEFSINETVVLGHRQYGPQLAVVSDPQPYGRGFLYTFTLISDDPLNEFVDPRFLQVGVEVHPGRSVIGEFDTRLPGLGRLNDTIELFESMGSAMGRSHTITKWADEMIGTRTDKDGNPLDLVVYYPEFRNNTTKKLTPKDIRWEPFIETLLRKKMLDDQVYAMIWQKAGVVRTGGRKQEYKRVSDGVYQRMRKHGFYHAYNRGEFTPQLIRTIFGDLFYRRVDMKDRRVKLFTNEAGMDVWQEALKKDALASGLNLISEVPAVQSGNIGVNDKSQKLVYSWAFNSMITRETGVVEVVHLKELDQPQTNLEFGQNIKSTPIFMVFNVSPDSNGEPANNVRQVLLKGAPGMTWGYIDGRISHLGHFASRGMSSASMDPWYTIWFESRTDVFIEDLSRCVLIEEIPQF